MHTGTGAANLLVIYLLTYLLTYLGAANLLVIAALLMQLAVIFFFAMDGK